MKIPARYAPLLFGGILSFIMVAIISCTVLLINRGYGPGFFLAWLKAFMTTWPIAFPAVLIVAPFVRRVVAKITT